MLLLIVCNDDLCCIVSNWRQQCIVSIVRVVGIHHVLQEALLLLQRVLDNGRSCVGRIRVALAQLVGRPLELGISNFGDLDGVGRGALEIVSP